MACIKSVNRSASVVLSPEAPLLAAGTMASAVDLSFSTSAFLEIFKLDFQSDDHELPLIGQTTSSERFNRLSWGKSGSNSEEFPLGLIAGGLLDGTIGVWNPQTITRSEASENPLVGQLSRHKGPVHGLEFNSIQPHLLASGADDGEICIWDLATPTEPSHFPPLRGSGSATQGEISFLSWNCKVPHILASTSYNGTTVVWDLKKQKPVISFSDSIRRRCSVLQWNPDMATQLLVASDDDASPSLRLWDMRNIMSPVKEFVGHTKGVISMAWCPSDSSYLLTCGKDNRTICWDTVSGEIVSELPAGTNWNFDVHWYPKIPGVISASSFDGKIVLYNVEACSHYGGETDFGAVPLRSPKWYKRPAGVSFGFGGKLVSFHSKSSPPAAQVGASEVYVHSLITEDSLVSRSSEFEAAIQNGDRSSLKVLCERKFQECKSEDESETWGFLKVMFDEDGMARIKLLTHLGFTLPNDGKDNVQDDLSQRINSIGIEENVMEKAAEITEDKGTCVFSYDNGEDFFNNLPSPKADTPVSTSGKDVDGGESAPAKSHADDTVEESPDLEFNDAVQHALVVGDYKGAVAQCMSANRVADALVIAHVGGASLWESSRDQYLRMSCIPYLKVVSAMVNHDLLSLVNTRPTKCWKETLALLCTFAEREEWTMLCDSLASKLMTSGNTLAATLCYICAGNIDKTVGIWSLCLTSEAEGKPYVERLQDLMEKTIVFALATGQKSFSASLCKLVEKYAEILASQGLLSTALEYLKLLGDNLSPELAVLRDRIAFAKNSAVVESQVQPGPVGANLSNYHVNGTSQSYYQEQVPSQMTPSTPGSYGENYQQYPISYPDTTPYQPVSQPSIFVPSQVPRPQVPQQTVAPQPAVRPFVPEPAPMLKNAQHFQQPPSFGSQLYPGAANASYQPVPPGAGAPGAGAPGAPQTGPVSGQRMPQVVAPTPTPRGFMPVTSPGVAQRSGVGSTQPKSPKHSTPAQMAAAPPAQPSTVQTADTSNVPAHQRSVIATLTRLYNETSETLGGARANAAKKREIEDNSKKLGALFTKLNRGDISTDAADKLVQLCQALDSGDYSTALQIQVQLTSTEWDECNFWLATLKRMIKTRQNVRL